MIFPTTIPYPDLPADRLGLKPERHTLPANIGLGTVTLQINDLGASIAYYTRVIGLTLHTQGEQHGQRIATLGISDSQTLLELREKPGVKYAPHRGRLGLYHFALLLPTRADLARFVRNALSLGVHVGSGDHHYSEATYLMDPDGISIEVYCDRPREEWQVTEGGEIVGRADPLDLHALVATAAATPWTGLPTGATIGHLHFYIVDLDQAARFYHAGLGFPKITWSFLAPSGLFLSVGGYHHHIGLNTWAAGSPPSGENDARLLTWELILPDQKTTDQTVASLRAEGFDVTPTPDGLLANDPWGITVRLRTA
ncbi:VOC family protein [Deinococcus peraridilitoris]|uniref:Putative ring-cleavage extradiol dioxygenase n=1 Tax=Deinococcus peraridilitoris (strain DSM 19664 / LMG 22246 / CIP 109416 / KR-200) TaxID=937777 RepID=L0A6X6_DEIPD|nr:VOC family protein [Deinococcus peraridilitoris]AFZ68947.1 putative ring-cleavage extradiol dioxygenase [Deinococcus peraridilitoris DSM 19664]